MKVKDLPGDHFVHCQADGHATAGTANEVAVCRVPFRATVTGVWWAPKSAVTGAATDHFTARLRNRVSGSGDVTIASKTFDNGVNAVALDDNVLTLTATAADLNVAEGDILTLQKVIVGNGLAMPDGLIVIGLKAR